MTRTALRWLKSSVACLAAVSVACESGPVWPDHHPAMVSEPGVSRARAPELGGCDKLDAPLGSTVAFHAYARGVQIYRWSGSAWVFVAPAADLFADAGGNGKIGTHSAGPTWESVSGSKVVAAVIDRCTPTPNAIPWLSLGAVSASGPGVFGRVAFIQRVNTVGGVAPSVPGSADGEISNVPYTAEYFFYRAP